MVITTIRHYHKLIQETTGKLKFEAIEVVIEALLWINSGFSSVPAKMPKNAKAALLAMSQAVHSFISLYICTLTAPGGCAYIRIWKMLMFALHILVKDYKWKKINTWVSVSELILVYNIFSIYKFLTCNLKISITPSPTIFGREYICVYIERERERWPL